VDFFFDTAQCVCVCVCAQCVCVAIHSPKMYVYHLSVTLRIDCLSFLLLFYLSFHSTLLLQVHAFSSSLSVNSNVFVVIIFVSLFFLLICSCFIYRCIQRCYKNARQNQIMRIHITNETTKQIKSNNNNNNNEELQQQQQQHDVSLHIINMEENNTCIHHHHSPTTSPSLHPNDLVKIPSAADETVLMDSSSFQLSPSVASNTTQLTLTVVSNSPHFAFASATVNPSPILISNPNTHRSRSNPNTYRSPSNPNSHRSRSNPNSHRSRSSRRPALSPSPPLSSIGALVMEMV
jgi:hypothetical protein